MSRTNLGSCFHVSLYAGVNARSTGGYYYTMAIERVKNEIQLSPRGANREIRWCSGVQFYKCGRKCNEPAALLQPRIPTDGTDDPIDRDHSITGADELLLHMLIIVSEAFPFHVPACY